MPKAKTGYILLFRGVGGLERYDLLPKTLPQRLGVFALMRIKGLLGYTSQLEQHTRKSSTSIKQPKGAKTWQRKRPQPPLRPQLPQDLQ